MSGFYTWEYIPDIRYILHRRCKDFSRFRPSHSLKHQIILKVGMALSLNRVYLPQHLN